LHRRSPGNLDDASVVAGSAMQSPPTEGAVADRSGELDEGAIRWRGTTTFLKADRAGARVAASGTVACARSATSWPRCSASTGSPCPSRHAGRRPRLGIAETASGRGARLQRAHTKQLKDTMTIQRKKFCVSQVGWYGGTSATCHARRSRAAWQGGRKCPPAPFGRTDPPFTAEVVSCGGVPPAATPLARFTLRRKRCPPVESSRLHRAAHLATVIFPIQEGSHARSTDWPGLRSAGSAPHRPRCWRPVREPFF